MRILIVEDDRKIAKAIKKGLEQESFAVDLEFNGSEGLGAALTYDYDLIILDRMLPGDIDGLNICKVICAQKPETQVLILTAKDKIKDRVEGLNCGADDYLIKPFAFEELLARVRALLRRPKNNLSNILKVGDLSLNTITFEVKRDKHLIKLSSKEFALLEYLMRHPGQILTKDQIIAHVWDYDADILPNTVEVFIGNLRNKIDRPFNRTIQSKNLIQTVRGFGYKIGERS